MVAVDSTGAIVWNKDLITLSGYMDEPYLAWLTGSLGGSNLVVYGIDEDVARYVVFNRDGAIAFDDTLERGTGTFSPCGKYFYDGRSNAEDIILQRAEGGVRRLMLPPLGDVPTTNECCWTQGLFAGPNRLLAITRIRTPWDLKFGKKYRATIIDLATEPAVMSELETPPSDEHDYYTIDYAASLHGGGLLTHEWGESRSDARISRYDHNGRLLWRSFLKMRQIMVRIVPALDRPLAAVVIDEESLMTMNIDTGKIIDSAGVWQDSSHPYWAVHEQWFEAGGIVTSVTGLKTGNEMGVTRVAIDEEGRIGASSVREEWMWGLGRRQPILGIAERCLMDSVCTVVGFRKETPSKR